MKHILLSSAAFAMIMAGSAFAMDDMKMPSTRQEAIQYHQMKIDKLKAMTDKDYADWKSKKAMHHKKMKHGMKSDNTMDIGTNDDVNTPKDNATSGDE